MNSREDTVALYDHETQMEAMEAMGAVTNVSAIKLLVLIYFHAYANFTLSLWKPNYNYILH